MPQDGTRREHLRQEMAKQRTKEKRQRRLVFSLVALAVLAVLGLVVGVIFQAQHKQKLSSSEDLTPSYLTTDRSFHITSSGAVDASKSTKVRPGSVRMQLIFDPQCPTCGAVDRALHDDLQSKLKAGTVDLWMTPVSFLDQSSTDQYSSRASNALVTVAQEDPTHFMDFITTLYKNQPGEAIAYTPVSDEKLAQEAEAVGVPQAVAEDFTKHKYLKWVEDQTEALVGRTDLYPDGKFSTPGLFLGGTLQGDNTLKDYTRVNFTSAGKVVQEFDEAVEKAGGK